jgi:hypothetical protein
VRQISLLLESLLLWFNNSTVEVWRVGNWEGCGVPVCVRVSFVTTAMLSASSGSMKVSVMAVTQPTFADINDWTHQQKARSHMSAPEATQLWDHTGLMHHKRTPEQIFNSYKVAVMWEEFVTERGVLNVTFCITLLDFIVVNKWAVWTMTGKNCWLCCCQTLSVLWWTGNLCWCSCWNKNCVSVS